MANPFAVNQIRLDQISYECDQPYVQQSTLRTLPLTQYVNDTCEKSQSEDHAENECTGQTINFNSFHLIKIHKDKLF